MLSYWYRLNNGACRNCFISYIHTGPVAAYTSFEWGSFGEPISVVSPFRPAFPKTPNQKGGTSSLKIQNTPPVLSHLSRGAHAGETTR